MRALHDPSAGCVCVWVARVGLNRVLEESNQGKQPIQLERVPVAGAGEGGGVRAEGAASAGEGGRDEL